MIIVYFSYIDLVTIKYSGVRHTQNTYNGIGTVWFRWGTIGTVVLYDSGVRHILLDVAPIRDLGRAKIHCLPPLRLHLFESKIQNQRYEDLSKHKLWWTPAFSHSLLEMCMGECAPMSRCVSVKALNFHATVIRRGSFSRACNMSDNQLCANHFYARTSSFHWTTAWILFLLVLLAVCPKSLQDHTYLCIVLKGGI